MRRCCQAITPTRTHLDGYNSLPGTLSCETISGELFGLIPNGRTDNRRPAPSIPLPRDCVSACVLHVYECSVLLTGDAADWHQDDPWMGLVGPGEVLAVRV